ncbi:hypothetical protein H4S04_000926 [Coemansia sp. S16]|nr:hypothetical protein H4S04_000926 [Coemansia sp. S16]
MSPVFGGDSVPNMPELLMPQTSPQTCTTGLTEASLALMNSLPSSPHAPLVCNDSGFVPVMQLDDDQLYSRICEYRASGMTWQDMSEAFSTIDGGGLSATHLAYFYFRRHPQQQSIPVASHRFVPYTVKKSSRKSDSTEHAKLAYLNVDQFKQLQRLVSECGEHNWEVISGIMAIRSGDLQKNWRGYTVHTNITRQWTRSEIEILALCRAIGVCCRTTAKLIGTKLPLQCRRKTIKHSDCIPATSVHCSANGPMYLVTSQQQPTSLAISHAFGLQQIQGQIEIDVASLAIARDIANTSVHSSGVRPILELAHRALPGYSQQTVNMCMLAILGSHPDYESGQQPPRSLVSAPPPQVKPVEIVAEETGEDDESVPEDLHKWSVYEIAFRGASYFSPMTQVVLVGFVCFLCPGMFNALNGMGGGGQVDRTTGNNANTALYCTFIIFGVLGGAIVNLCGVRWTIFGSGLTYALYSSSYIYLNHTGNGAFTIAAGAILGIGAGILWAAQGMIMVSYPREEEKGRYIAVFWIIFNMGGMLGGILPFAINYNSTKDSLSDGVYIAFVILECIGAALGLALAPPSKVVREDGSSVVLVKYTSVRIEAVEILKLFMNPMMLALLPMCFASNFFYSYQFGPINGSIFNIRTRGFNNIFYWGAQMIGAYALSFLLDNQRMTRKTRGIIALGIVAVFFNVVWGGTLKLQQKYTHGPLPGGIPTDYPGGLIDFLESKRAAGPIILYTLHGVGDALYQNLAYWVIGSLTNDGQKLSRYAGFYKGIQSLGATVAWQLDAKSVSYMNQLIGNWVLLGISMFPMFYVVYTLKDHSEETKVQTDDYDDREKV